VSELEDRAFRICKRVIGRRSAQTRTSIGDELDGLARESFDAAVAFAREATRRGENDELRNSGLSKSEASDEGQP
jgi:hypothetical protein